MTKKQQLFIDYSLFAVSRSAQISAVFSLAIVSSSSAPPSQGGHSTPLSSPPVVMTTEGVCLSAGRHSEQSYNTTDYTSRLIYTERSCHWWFLAWSSAVCLLKNTSCLLLIGWTALTSECCWLQVLQDTWAAASIQIMTVQVNIYFFCCSCF